MSSKIDGVPRELLERLQSQTELSNDWDEVQALLVAPVVERQGVALAESREMRVYIAGPMTGIEDYNFPAFNAMADKMRAAGWHVENPADHGVVDGAEWADYLRYDISKLSACEAIMLLPGWSSSRGARLEVSIAKEIGVVLMFACGAEREASPPAPVAVRITLQQVLKAYDYAESHPHKYLRGTTNWCAAVAHELNACLDKVKELNQ